MNSEEFWERAERLTAFVVDETLPATRDADGIGSERDSREPPSGYDASDARSDMHAATRALPGGTAGDVGYRKMWHLNVLYPLSVAAVADDQQLSMAAKRVLFPEDMDHMLTSARLETYPGDSDDATWPRSRGVGPAREKTATHLLRRLRHDVRRPSSLARYAGALCCLRWLANVTMYGVGDPLPAVVDAIPDTEPGSPLRRGAVTSAFFVANWGEASPPPHEYVDGLSVALEDPDDRIRSHAAAAVGEVIRTGRYGRGDPEQFREGADALLELLEADGCPPRVARTILSWLAYRDWDRLEEEVPQAVPENAAQRTKYAVESYLDADHELVRRRADHVASFRTPW